MSRYDYVISMRLGEGDPPFAALIMAALRKADTPNAAQLWAMWPDICREMQDRYYAPGGVLPSDPTPDPPASSGSRQRAADAASRGS